MQEQEYMDESSRSLEPINETLKEQKIVKGEGRQHNVPALDGRPALRDISNLVNEQDIKRKKVDPVTHDKSIDNEVKKKRPETANQVSSNEIESIRNQKCSRKGRMSFTSTLWARSKTTCVGGVANNDVVVLEYADEIYKFYKDREDGCKVRDYMHEQLDINEKMRSILVDWLIEVHRKFEFMPETLFLTIYIIDRFLSLRIVPRRELQLVGISSMLIACKFEERWTPQVKDFVSISDNAYTRIQVRAMEKRILTKLDWYIAMPTPYLFLPRFTKASSEDQVMENMAYFVSELGLMEYPVISKYTPSTIAASSVYVARCILELKPFWTPALQDCTGFSEARLRGCATYLSRAHSIAAESKLNALQKKYSCSERASVALIKSKSANSSGKSRV